MEVDLHKIFSQVIKICQKIEETILTLLKLEVLVLHRMIIELKPVDLELHQIIMQRKQKVLVMLIMKDEAITFLMIFVVKKDLLEDNKRTTI